MRVEKGRADGTNTWIRIALCVLATDKTSSKRMLLRTKSATTVSRCFELW